jgi:hypothetical protein
MQQDPRAHVLSSPRMPPDPPGLAIHVGTGDCRDTVERTSRLAAAAGITSQRMLLGAQADRAEVIGGLRRGAAGLDPPEIAWCLSDGTLPLTEVAALLGTVVPTAFITVMADTCYAAALSRFAFPATVVLLAACGADQEILAHPATGFATRLEQLVLADGQPNPACTSYLWLGRQFRRDSPDSERPLVWTNRPFVWSLRPFRPISGPSRPARPVPAGAVLARRGGP